MKHTLGTASKATGKAKSTILRAIKNGTISAHKSRDGSYEIDPAELHRVFDPVGSQNSLIDPEEPPEHGPATLKLRLSILEAEREREREQMQATIDDLRKRLDSSENRITALLGDHRTKRDSWWPWRRT